MVTKVDQGLVLKYHGCFAHFLKVTDTSIQEGERMLRKQNRISIYLLTCLSTHFIVQKLQQPRFPPLAASTCSRTFFSVKKLTKKANVYEIRSELVERLQFLVNIGERMCQLSSN